MSWELGDNTSDGIRFALVGAGSLLVLRLLHAGVLLLMEMPGGDELGASMAHFRVGYWISNTDVLVTTAHGIGTRLALGLSVSFVVALLAAGATYALARMVGKESGRLWLLVLRTALIVTLGWSLFAALLLPPSTATLSEHGLTITQRPALFGVLTLPGAARTETTPWSAIEAVEALPTAEGHSVRAVKKVGAVILCTGEQADAEELARVISARYLGR